MSATKNGYKIFHRDDIVITSPFGNRIDPITHKPAFHNGVDYGTQYQKLPQYGLANDGVVTMVGKDGHGANYVYVRYPSLSDHVGVYYHLDRYCVKLHQKVDTNTIIGYTGTTGRSTGIHLHFGWFDFKKNGSWQNFEKYDFPTETPKPVPTPTPSQDKKHYYRVQVGSFIIKSNAERYKARLLKDGFQAIIVKSGLNYRVQVGAYEIKSNAENMMNTLARKNYKGFIVE